MKLRALLMTRHGQPLRPLTAALDEVRIAQEHCASAQEAIELLARGKYAAIVLDFDLPGAPQVAKLARVAPAHRRPVVFAMIGALTDIGGTYQAGANFVLYKPLIYEQVARSVRAAHGFMLEERRRLPRQNVATVVYLLFGRRLAIPTLMLDLNEEGLSVQAAEPLPAMDRVPLHFMLPGSAHVIEGVADVVWADDAGRAGMFFSQLTSSAQRSLRDWLKRQSAKRSSARLPKTLKPGSITPVLQS
jgi:PilZ domain